jgi:hypothetical protein
VIDLASVVVGIAPIVVEVGILGLQRDSVGIVGNSAIEFALLFVGVAAAVVSASSIAFALPLSALNDRCAVMNLLLRVTDLSTIAVLIRTGSRCGQRNYECSHKRPGHPHLHAILLREPILAQDAQLSFAERDCTFVGKLNHLRVSAETL